jgi:hypothetical protein
MYDGTVRFSTRFLLLRCGVPLASRDLTPTLDGHLIFKSAGRRARKLRNTLIEKSTFACDHEEPADRTCSPFGVSSITAGGCNVFLAEGR